MQQDELKKFLTEIAAERLALLLRHEAAARVVGNYDFNNTYQYVIAREQTHLEWLQSALSELGATVPQSTLPLTTPEAPKGKKPDVAAYHDTLAADAKFLSAADHRRPLAKSRSDLRGGSSCRGTDREWDAIPARSGCRPSAWLRAPWQADSKT